jgi:polyisoprenoid-binding protein YceI
LGAFFYAFLTKGPTACNLFARQCTIVLMLKQIKNMKRLFSLVAATSLSASLCAQVFMGEGSSIRMFSAAPLENIEATSNSVGAAINTQSGKVYFKVNVRTFTFENSLMQEHFNENYIESEKYPYAIFDGTVKDLPDLSKDGEYDVVLAGNFSLHGVTKAREIPAKLTVANGAIEGNAVFHVKCADHKIKIPRLVVKNIAEEVEVTVKSHMTPKQ